MVRRWRSTGLAVALAIGFGGALPDPCLAREPAAVERRQAARGQGVEAEAEIAIAGPGDYSFSLVHGGVPRFYRVHVPAAYSPSRPVPLVFSFHGGGGSMDYQADDSYYGQISKAEEGGYVAVFPNGYSRLESGRLATWNAGKCCGAARDRNADDVGFVREIVRRLSRQLNVDPDRIYASGMSNGGMMAYRLACEMPDVFRAVASVAGTDNTRGCAPAAPISVLHIHARDDDLALFEGGAGRRRAAVTSFVSVPDSVAKWVRLNGCSAAPQRVFENPGAYCDAYSQCRGGVEVKLCVTATGGHSWPGSRKPRSGTPPSRDLSATDLIWDFFRQH